MGSSTNLVQQPRLQPTSINAFESSSADPHKNNDSCLHGHPQQFYKHYSRRKYLPLVISLVIIVSFLLPANVSSTKSITNPNHSSYEASKHFKDLLVFNSFDNTKQQTVRSKRDTVAALYSGLPSTRSGNSAIYFGQSSNNVNSNEILYSVDNRKPAFKNCAGYKPSVKEEQPENTYVIMVEAEDPDPDQEIKYSLVQSAAERPKFRINPTTGVIVTEHTFDRDEPIHEKAVYVTVQATDNGRPPLDDVCTFKVTIEDINDNPPVFNKARYEESMSEDKQVCFGLNVSVLTFVHLFIRLLPIQRTPGLLLFGNKENKVIFARSCIRMYANRC